MSFSLRGVGISYPCCSILKPDITFVRPRNCTLVKIKTFPPVQVPIVGPLGVVGKLSNHQDAITIRICEKAGSSKGL